MKPDREHNDRNTIDAFLDGMLSADEVRDLRERVDKSDLERVMTQQASIDDTLQRLFKPSQISIEKVLELLGERTDEETLHTSRDGIGSRRVAVLVAIAALVAWLFVAIQFRAGDRDEPLFVSRPLVSIYNDAVAQGFEPYYECREPDRFAYTFQQRQGVSVDLEPMPEGSGMLGLSYSGGLSRATTVMLCTVDDQPVMVFVDRLAEDSPSSSIVAGTDGLNVFRDQRDGLVLYEVTPFDSPRAAPYLRPRTAKN